MDLPPDLENWQLWLGDNHSLVQTVDADIREAARRINVAKAKNKKAAEEAAKKRSSDLPDDEDEDDEQEEGEDEEEEEDGEDE